MCGGCIDGLCSGNCHRVMRQGKVRKHSGKEYERVPEDAMFLFEEEYSEDNFYEVNK